MAKHIPKAFIEQVNSRTDLVQLIHARVPLKKAGSNYTARCPFHEEKTPSFTVSENKQFYHCFGCGASGDAIRFLMDYDNLTFQEAVELLAQQLGLTVPYEQTAGDVPSEADKKHSEAGLACLAEAAAYYHRQFYQPQAQAARGYLKARGLKRSTVDTFSIGYAPGGNALLAELQGRYSMQTLQAVGLVGEKDGRYYDWFRQRIVFPIYNARGQVIAFGARALGNEMPKYLNSPETDWFNKRYELYGLYQALQADKRGKTLLVTEGYMDVVKLWQNGLQYSVAALGTAIGETHIGQLKKRAQKIYFSFDGDSAGQKAAAKALEAIFGQYDERHDWRFMFMPAGEDPDSLMEKDGVEAFHAIMDRALPPSDFLIKLLQDEFGEERSVEGNVKLVQRAQEWLGLLTDETYRSLLREALQQEFSLPEIATIAVAEKTTRGVRENDYRATKVSVVSTQSADFKLSAFLLLYPQWALDEKPCLYDAGLLAQLPWFWRLCYHIQTCGANPKQVEQFLVEHELLMQVKSLADAHEVISEQQCRQEMQDILQQLSRRETEKRTRLEKLGISPH